LSNNPEQAQVSAYRIHIRDLILAGRIGILDRERRGPQRLRLNVELLVDWPVEANDDYRRVLNYEIIIAGMRRIVGADHINLVETLAERLMEVCLADERVQAATVRVEKLDIYSDADSVGVVLTRRRRATA
jgi:dihydroneopterin aldolase